MTCSTLPTYLVAAEVGRRTESAVRVYMNWWWSQPLDLSWSCSMNKQSCGDDQTSIPNIMTYERQCNCTPLQQYGVPEFWKTNRNIIQDNNFLNLLCLGGVDMQLHKHAWNDLDRQLLLHLIHDTPEWDLKIMIIKRMVQVIV